MALTIGRSRSAGRSFSWRTPLRLAGPVAIWAWFSLMLIPYSALRGIGDSFFAPHDIKGFETAIFGGVIPSRWLQVHLHQQSARDLDYLMFLAHLSWFFLPFIWGLVIAFTDRKKLFEFYGWVLTLSYLSTLFFLVAPTRPPWMEAGVTRVLLDRSFVQYTQLDSNAYAAFPSMHAGLPMTMALFFFLRSEKKKGYGFIVLAHCLWVSFAIVYLGEHWVIDVLGGWALAAGAAFLFTSRTVRRGVETLPGDPLRRLIGFNNWLMDLGLRRGGTFAAEAPAAMPEVEQWAA
jgi:membrane-associated phospholipid phosphatase